MKTKYKQIRNKKGQLIWVKDYIRKTNKTTLVKGTYVDQWEIIDVKTGELITITQTKLF